MKIAFIEPEYKHEGYTCNQKFLDAYTDKKKHAGLYNNANLGLLTLAAQVPTDWEIQYIHTPIEKIDYNEQFDIVALGGMTRQANEIYRIIDKFKTQGVYTVMGGIHATVCHEEAASHAHTVIVGEGEDSFPRFLEDFSSGAPKSCYGPSNEIDLMSSPLPRYDLITGDFQNYPVQTTRGCPRNCKFCAATRIYGKSYRHKTSEQVVQEIQMINSVRRNPFILFVDDNMFIHKAFSRELLQKLIPLDIRFQALSDISIGEDQELLELMYKAGCKELFIGLESPTSHDIAYVQHNGWKANQTKHYSQLIRNIQDHGIRIYGSFILGFDNHTQDHIARIKEFVWENKILGQFSILTPFPGTEFYDEFKQKGRLREDKSWYHYNLYDCVIHHPNFSARELEDAIIEIFEFTFSDENYARVVRRQIEGVKNMEYKKKRV